MDFEKICMMFTMQEAYYGILLSSMDRKPVPANLCPTLGVGRNGNTFRLYYNPDFVDSLPVDTVLELLKHECLHVAMNHFTIFEEETNDKQELTVRNIANDLEINGYLDRSKISSKAGGCFAEDMGWEKYLGSREYYRRLKQKQQEQQQSGNPDNQCNGGQGGKKISIVVKGKGGQNKGGDGDGDAFIIELGNKSFDDHSMWPKEMSEAEKELLTQAIEELVVFAADEVEKSCGEVPGCLKGKIESIRKRKKPKPVADWKRYFRRYIGHEFSEFLRKSKKRESRRFPDAAGNRHQRKSNILVGIDTSGSVSMPEYMEFMGQLRTLSETSNFHVVECDARIQFEYDYYGRPNETLHGGGGTSFNPVIDLYLQNQRKYEGLVYFTDGYCDIPKNTPKETLWVISSKGDQNRDKYKVNGGKAVFIPAKQ